MSEALVSLLSQLDGAVLGFALAYAAIRTFSKFSATYAVLCKLRHAPYLSVSDLRSLLADAPSDADSTSNDSTIVIVRGTVDAKSAVNSSWKTLKPDVLVSQASSDKGVIFQRTQMYIYNEWKGLFGWTYDLGALFKRSWRQEFTSLRKVPFVLIDVGRRPSTPEYVVVNMDGSRHPLPLTIVYYKLHLVKATPYTFSQVFFGHKYPVGLLDAEKILPLGKDITVVGLGSLNNGVAEIKSCKDLPYFLSDLSKDQMIVDLSIKTKILFWDGIAFGLMSVGIFGYAVVRNWNKWKQWKLRRQLQQQRQAVDEIEDVPDGQLCLTCLTRRSCFAFIPCGHRVCCQVCVILVEREVAPRCPVCSQEIQNSVQIFER